MNSDAADAASPRATLIGSIALLLWATLALLTSLASSLPPFQLVAMAFALAAIASFARWIARGEAIGPKLRQPLGAWALGVGGLFGYHFCYFVALRLAPPLEANLLNYLWPLLIVLFSALLPGGGLRTRHVVGAFAGLAGAVVLIAGGERVEIDIHHAWGDALALACAAIWAGYSVLNRRHRDVPSDAVGGFCAATALLALACHFVFETSVWPQGWQWAVLAGLGLGPVGLAFFAWDYGCKRGDIRALGLLAYLVPLLSNALLIAAGRGQFTPAFSAALLLIVGGAAIGAGDSMRRSA